MCKTHLCCPDGSERSGNKTLKRLLSLRLHLLGFLGDIDLHGRHGVNGSVKLTPSGNRKLTP